MSTSVPANDFLGLRQLAGYTSEILSRAGLAMRAGITFKGKRDLFEALGFQRLLRVADYRARYYRGGIAARIVEAYPKATWRGGAEVIESENPEIVTRFEAEWEKLEKRLRCWTIFQRADVLAGLGRFSVILIGLPGETVDEVPMLTGCNDVHYLAAFSEDEVSVEDVVIDTGDPRFGQPLRYKLSRTNTVGGIASIEKMVHWTRIIHVADNILDDIVYGSPRMERVWNDLDNLDKVVGGGSEAFWLRVNQGLFFNIDPAAKIEPKDVDSMKAQAEEFAHGMQRTLAMRGASMESLGSDVSNFAGQVTSLISLISGATGIPQRILLGSERGELASSQDKENWDTRVSDRRTDFAEPCLVRPFINRLIRFGALPKCEFTVRWPDYDDLGESERATIADQWAGLNAKAGGTVVLPNEIRDRVLKLDPLSEAEEVSAPIASPAAAPAPGVLPAAVPSAAPVVPSVPPAATAVARRVAAPSGPKATGRQSEE